MSVKIVSGKKGWCLKIDGCYICQGFKGDIVALKSQVDIPYGATEWVSIQDIRSFWGKYRILVVDAAKRPFVGTLTISAFEAALRSH